VVSGAPGLCGSGHRCTQNRPQNPGSSTIQRERRRPSSYIETSPVFSENPARPNVFSKVFTPAPADGKRPFRSKPTFTPLRDPIGPTFKVFSRPGTQPENTPKPVFYPFIDKSKRSENEVRRKSVGKRVTISPHGGGEEEDEQREDRNISP
jgi:hypothetical protein